MTTTRSEAIWINGNRRARDPIEEASSGFRRTNLFGVQRSMSFASDGSSAHNTPYGSYTDPFESTHSRRMRTISFNGTNDDDSWSTAMSTSAPNANNNPVWRRSNSINQTRGRNLSRIEEHGRMLGFGDTIQKSIDKLFTSPAKSINQERKVAKDQVVSMLCEGALR